MSEEQWYTNKDLFEQIQGLKIEIASLSADLAETSKLIKEYNSLRSRLDICELKLAESSGKSIGAKDLWGWVVGIAGFIALLYSFAKDMFG